MDGKPVRLSTGRNTIPRRSRAILLMAAILACGCSQLIDPNVPDPLRSFVEPEFGREYLLYRPSHYDREHDWPLIVVCHTSFPDSPNHRIREWTESAESYGFLVAAPTLRGVKRFRPPKAAKQVELQREDERTILSMIRHIRAGHTISDDRIFIHGWSGGAYVALHTGLRNADVFRAVSLTRPKFDEGYLGDVARHLSSYQPIDLSYDLSDAIMGKPASRLLSWLRTHGATVLAKPGGVSANDAQGPIEFFEKVIRDHPWIHVRALPGPSRSPFEVQFKIRGSHQATRYRWDFGDGATSDAAEPVYTYAEPGTYVVTLTVGEPDGGEIRRVVRLAVPSGTLDSARAASKAAP